MTREEAIKELKEMIDYVWGTYQTKTARIYVNALNTAIKALEQEQKTDRWNEPENPPSDDRYILLSFSNSRLPTIGKYKGNEEEGGNYYEDDDDKPLIHYGLIVNGWQELPKCRED